ncbi:MAG: YfiR family protein [Planctomycetota bacterium]|jgi:hypothetical protein
MMLIGMPLALTAQVDKATITEYKIKTALIYNLLKFTTWPEKPAEAVPVADKKNNRSKTLTLGFFSDSDIYAICKTIDGKKVKDMKIQIVRIYERDLKREDPEFWSKLDALYLSRMPNAMRVDLKKLFNILKGRSILTLGESFDFLSRGGIVRLLREGNHVNFEINLDAAKLAQLEIKTSVLKLAKRVIQTKEPKSQKP